ncbi:MAG: hypothetical protein ACTSQ8_26245 [Candidatus Helarchaeota archaeon]
MFNLVVTCVGSKNYEGPSINKAISNLANNGIKDDVKELFNEWKNMLTSHMKSFSSLPKAKNIYSGAMWNASVEAFNRIKEERQLWIMSCGFGFINSKENISGYHATFKRRENDSLYNTNYFTGLKNIDVKKQWWKLLTERGIIETNNPRSIHELVNNSKPTDVVLIAAGSDYYEAIFDDLNMIDISDKLPKMALVGIKRDGEKYKPRIPIKLEPYIQSYRDGRALREFLGCSAIQVQPSSASYLIKQYYNTGELSYKFP